MYVKGILALILACGLLTGPVRAALAADAPGPDQQQEDTIGRTPPRLSFADGQVSFWRPGAQDWAQAQVNTPLAPGDQLATGSPGNLEMQIDARAFVRAWANTQVGLDNQEPDFLQFKVTSGHASFDLRALEPGRTVEVDTPNAAFTIEHPGYYRVDIDGDRTSFIARRSGRATVVPASGEAVAVAPSEEVIIEGAANPQVTSYAAPKLDVWDKWNYARTDELLDSVSARYVPPGTYGVDDLDHYGTWRVVPDYGSVWVPTAVQSDWAPYSTGSWVLDPSYGWTWVDTAPWGWAPFHYGRWVFVDRFWAWAPGPLVARPVYAPALVAFLGAPVGVGVSIGGPFVGWVALGWGEPCVPWWGRPGFVHRPWWGGWGGPRVVNNVVINRTTVVNVEHINVYRNVGVQNAVVAVQEQRFGHGPVGSGRIARVDVKSLQPIHTGPRIAAVPASFSPTETRGIRPPEESMRRSVVATRAPHHGAEPGFGAEHRTGPAGVPTPAPRIVSVPSRTEPASALPRAPFGQSTIERPTGDRPPTPPRQGPEGSRRTQRVPEGQPAATRPMASPSQPTPPSASASPTAPAKGEPAAVPPRAPGGQGAVPRPPTDRAEPPSSQRPERSRRPEGTPQSTPPEPRQAAPPPRPEAKAAGPSPAAPQPSAPQRGRSPAAHPERPRPPAQPLPGEPASRLAPNRAEMRPAPPAQREASPPASHPQNLPEKAQRERPGG